jgi:hypothetical protein
MLKPVESELERRHIEVDTVKDVSATSVNRSPICTAF